MAIIGVDLEECQLILHRGRDFKWTFVNLDQNQAPLDFSAGQLFIELATPGGFTIWPFVITGSVATIQVESEESDKIVAWTKWQLVFLPTGEVTGGDPIARGIVRVQQ